jgi:polar amino acid transport system substrate-binding protein
MPKWVFLIFCFVGVLASAATHSAERVVLYGDSAYPPYSFVEDGQFKGIYVDILRKAAERLAPTYAVELLPVPWKRGLLYLKSGEGFALFPPGLKRERDYIQAYSVPLYRETVAVFCNDKVMQSNPQRFPEDFAGLTMGINTGFLLSDRLVQAAKAGVVKLEEAPNNEANLRKITLQRIDCYVSDRGAALYTAKQMRAAEAGFKIELHETAILSGEDTFIGYSGIANPPYKDDFIKRMDAVLTTLKRDGEFAKIINSYSR